MRFLQFSTNHHRLYLFWTLAIVGLAMPWGCEWTRDFGRFTTQSECTVDSIHEGDTMRLTCSGEKVKVRLYCIDAPEMGQRPWGRQYRDHLRAITLNRVHLIHRDKDKYGRTVGEVFAIDGKKRENLNLAQVRTGNAAVYTKYCRESRYFKAEANARGIGSGIWAQSGRHQTSWKYRSES